MGKTVLVVLLIAGAILLVARFGSAQRGTQANSPGTSPAQVLADDTKLIDEGQFESVTFRLSGPAKISVNVKLESGPPIDAYLVDEQGLNAWQAMASNHTASAFSYVQALSMAPLASEYSRQGEVGPGEYALVIDNSQIGATSPPLHLFKRDPALVRYRISVGG